MDQQLRECLKGSLDELRTAIRDETAKTCRHIDAFGERLKPGRFLRYLETRAAEIAVCRGGAREEPELDPRRSVVYEVLRPDRDDTAR